jgi:hypothetical protein
VITNWPVALPVAIGTLAHEWLVATCLVAALFVVTPVSALSQAVSPWQPVTVASNRPDRSFFRTVQCRTVSFEREIKPPVRAQ